MKFIFDSERIGTIIPSVSLVINGSKISLSIYFDNLLNICFSINSNSLWDDLYPSTIIVIIYIVRSTKGFSLSQKLWKAFNASVFILNKSCII